MGKLVFCSLEDETAVLHPIGIRHHQEARARQIGGSIPRIRHYSKPIITPPREESHYAHTPFGIYYKPQELIINCKFTHCFYSINTT
jgi:hypothetical protein